MLQPKDLDWLNGYKNKTYIYIYVACKRSISDLVTHTDGKWGDRKSLFQANRNWKKTGVKILIW